MKSKSLLMAAVLLLCAAVFLCGCTGTQTTDATDDATTPAAGDENVTKVPTETVAPVEGSVLNVFHAGSLAKPFEELEQKFEAAHPGVDVRLYAGGSTKLAREITELGKTADVYATADYLLIPDLMVPAEKADWYLTFAKNRLVLCYTNESKYANELNDANWYTILAKDDVNWAFSDPNQDPCGYRSPMVIQLAELHYGDDQIFENTVSAHSNITVTEENGTYTIHAAEPAPELPLQIRPKSVELVQMLQAGGLDYAWEYRSVAVQHGLNFLELPEAIDLSSVECADTYKKVQIDCTGGIKVATPVVYGVTVPTNAEDPAMGLEFVKMLIGEEGQAIMNGQGQPPIVPASGFGDVPAELADLTSTP
ncbi:tungstate ABC transporter substrate-binding protein WtpA [Methanofollis formosanus]|nr:tungstate ABC transporter substrate-binding protein WtpA [Methanofollis formosanus]